MPGAGATDGAGLLPTSPLSDKCFLVVFVPVFEPVLAPAPEGEDFELFDGAAFVGRDVVLTGGAGVDEVGVRDDDVVELDGVEDDGFEVDVDVGVDVDDVKGDVDGDVEPAVDGELVAGSASFDGVVF